MHIRTCVCIPAPAVNYVVIGGMLLYFGASGTSAGQRVALLAKGSYACLYLLNAFSQLVTSANATSRVIGLAHRVEEALAAANGYAQPHSEESSAERPYSCAPLLHPVRLLQRAFRWMPGHIDPGTEVDPHCERLLEVCAEEADRHGTDSGIMLRALPLKSESQYSVRQASDNDSELTNIPSSPNLEGFSPKDTSSVSNKSAVESLERHTMILRIRGLDVYPGGLSRGRGPGLPLLLRQLCLNVFVGMRILVTGYSGVGKSSLLQAIFDEIQQQQIHQQELHNRERNDQTLQPASAYTGLGCRGVTGAPKRHQSSLSLFCPPASVVVCPQTPFCFVGTLLSNLLYPDWCFPPRAKQHQNTASCCRGDCRLQSDLEFDCGLAPADEETKEHHPVSLIEVQAVLEQVGLPHFVQYLNGADEEYEEAGVDGRGRSIDNCRPAGTREDLERGAIGCGGVLSCKCDDSSSCGSCSSSGSSKCDVGGESLPVHRSVLRHRDWAAILSPGEKQRIAVARLILRRPRLASAL